MKVTGVGKLKHHSAGTKSVLTAVAGNFIVALLKTGSWFFTGSSVMLSEGIHSFADTANQSLLFLGIKRSEKPANDEFQYGYLQERFFWSLVSACGIFFLGAGITFYHGLRSLMHPEAHETNLWLLIILLISAALEGYALLTAITEAKEAAGEEPVLKFLKHSADPTVLAVIYEDSAALFGILIAFIATILTELTKNPIWDSIGSIFVSLLLAIVAILLMNVNRKYILHKSVPSHIRAKIKKVLEEEELVDEIHDLKTIMIGVDGFIVKAEIEINGHFLSEKIIETRDMNHDYEEIKDFNHFTRYTSDLCDQATRIMGREIDELEKRVMEKIPSIRHLDIETN